MELRHLRYFVAVAEHENITRAAAELHITQPSLSRQIRDLENDLDVPLFEHGAKNLRLSEAGRAFLPQARAVLRQATLAAETARAAARGQLGAIQLGYAPSLAVRILPRLLRHFQESHPGVRVKMHDLSTREMLKGLHKGTLDAALMVRPPLPETNLDFMELERHRVCVALAPEHPLATRKSVKLAQVAAEGLVTFTLADYPEYHAWIASMFTAAIPLPRIAEEHESASSLIAAVEAGRGAALVSEQMECLSGRRLAILPVTPAPPPLVIGIAMRNGPCSRALDGLLETARAVAATEYPVAKDPEPA